MKVITFLVAYVILHAIVFVGVSLGWFGLLSPLFSKTFLLALVILALVDIVLALYFLVFRSPKINKHYNHEYQKLNIEEADKYLRKKE